MVWCRAGLRSEYLSPDAENEKRAKNESKPVNAICYIPFVV